MDDVHLYEVGTQHELRLVTHGYNAPGMQPYCICGWIGEAVHFFECEKASQEYRRHLEDADG